MQGCGDKDMVHQAAFVLPVISLVIITILNDGTMITISHDKVGGAASSKLVLNHIVPLIPNSVLLPLPIVECVSCRSSLRSAPRSGPWSR